MKAASNIESCPAFWQMQMLQLPFSGWICITGCTLNANHENLWSVIMMIKLYHKAGIHRSWVPGCHGVFFIIASRIFFILFWKFYIFAYFYITFSNLCHVVLILSCWCRLQHWQFWRPTIKSVLVNTSDASYSQWSETRSHFISIALQLFFTTCHWRGVRKRLFWIEWDVSVLYVCWWCLLGESDAIIFVFYGLLCVLIAVS